MSNRKKTSCVKNKIKESQTQKKNKKKVPITNRIKTKWSKKIEQIKNKLPFTMMVELSDAFITDATVFGT